VAMYLIPLLASVGAAYLILSGRRLALPAPLARLVDAFAQAVSQAYDQARDRILALFKWRTAP